DPDSLCEAVAGLVEHTLGGTIEIDWQCGHRKNNLFVDQPQLELALLNLILNARDSMPDGGKVVVAIGEPAPGTVEIAGDWLSIRVTDQGAGIPPENVSRITEPFFTTKESGKGTGLGLSMVVGFVQQSGGQLNIDSVMGEGSTVEMILPGTPQPPAATVLAVAGDSSALRVQRILLVDDDDAVRTVLGEQLREMGLSVEEAADGKAAIERLKQGHSYDFMLTDFAMPGLNGLETIRRAVKQAPAMRAALMTGYADEDSTAEAREMVTILRKPIEMRDLLVALS
ncbi:MAG: ATP-binding protein, partial [Sphingomicrobium sp.]